MGLRVQLGLFVVALAVSQVCGSDPVADCSSIGGCAITGFCTGLNICTCSAGYTGQRCEIGFSGALGCVLPENNPVNETILLGCINPVVCSNVCRQQGFLFASVNTDCSCGNTPPMTIEHGNKCTVACLAPSDDQGCGGPNGKALVFEAGYFFDRTVMQVTV